MKRRKKIWQHGFVHNHIFDFFSLSSYFLPCLLFIYEKAWLSYASYMKRRKKIWKRIKDMIVVKATQKLTFVTRESSIESCVTHVNRKKKLQIGRAVKPIQCLRFILAVTKVMSHVWMNESCRTYEWVMSHIWMNASCRTYEWVSHVAHMNEWVMSHIWMN